MPQAGQLVAFDEDSTQLLQPVHCNVDMSDSALLMPDAYCFSLSSHAVRPGQPGTLAVRQQKRGFDP